jgi:hypothetical protein
VWQFVKMTVPGDKRQIVLESHGYDPEIIVRLQTADDALSYVAAAPDRDEFSGEDGPLAWEGEGWDNFRRSAARSASTHFGLMRDAVRF